MQRKKKPNRQQAQHLAAQYRSDFFRKMKLIIDSVCGNHIYPLIPKNILDEVYLCRVSPFRYRAHCDSNVPPVILRDCKVILSRLIKGETMLLPPHNLEITVYDYFTVVLTIVVLRKFIENDAFDDAHVVSNALMYFLNGNNTTLDASNKLFSALNIFSFGESDFRDKIYWFDYNVFQTEMPPYQLENRVTIYTETPEIINVEVDGAVRPASRVGWAFSHTGPEWLSLKPSLLGVKSPFAEIPLNVYIQAHALNRLSERIDCFWTGYAQVNMYASLRNPKLAYDVNHNLLIEYTFFGTKAGYFRADIVNGIILIRTFLFVTNNGTPEGQLLEKNTGLQKLDKKYLNIDKLSTFMNSDLDKNLEVQKIFKSAGCQCLIDLYNKTKAMSFKNKSEFNFDVMLSYIDPDKTRENKCTVLDPNPLPALQTG